MRHIVLDENISNKLQSPYKIKNLDVPTYFNREAWRQAQGNEVTQLCKVGIGNGHKVNDGCHLLGQRQRVALTQPQCGFKPAKEVEKQSEGRRQIMSHSEPTAQYNATCFH